MSDEKKYIKSVKKCLSVSLITYLLRSCFKCWQWEALALLLIGISINQLRTSPAGSTAFGLPITAIAYIYTVIFVSCCQTIWSLMFYLFLHSFL
jgi:hypothetical protein